MENSEIALYICMKMIIIMEMVNVVDSRKTLSPKDSHVLLLRPWEYVMWHGKETLQRCW